MKLYPFVMALILASPVLAVGNLTVTGTSLAPAYANTITNTTMLNLSLNVSGGDGSVTITSMNITVTGSATIGNVSQVNVINSAGSLIAYNNTNSTSNNFTLTIPSGLLVNASTNSTVIISINISSLATRLISVSINMTSASFATDVGPDNVTITGGSVQASSQIQDLHAYAGITPRYIDTNVINQSLSYSITVTGLDAMSGTSITLPTGYTLVSLSSVSRSGTVLPLTDYTNTTADNSINITFTAPSTLPISINFTVNTSASTVSAQPFNSTIYGGNVSTVTVLLSADNTTVTTQQLISITNTQIFKGAAYVNGTDYWDFNFTLNFTANVTGVLQFKMNNWTNSAGDSMALTNSAGNISYASVWDVSNSTRVINVTNTYNITSGVLISGTQGVLDYIALRMIIPLTATVSSSWWTTYSMLFRSA